MLISYNYRNNIACSVKKEKGSVFLPLAKVLSYVVYFVALTKAKLKKVAAKYYKTKCSAVLTTGNSHLSTSRKRASYGKHCVNQVE